MSSFSRERSIHDSEHIKKLTGGVQFKRDSPKELSVSVVDPDLSTDICSQSLWPPSGESAVRCELWRGLVHDVLRQFEDAHSHAATMQAHVLALPSIPLALLALFYLIPLQLHWLSWRERALKVR